MLKVALISDIHFGPDRGTKKGTSAFRLVTQFKDWLGENRCDLVVDLGDRISDVDRTTDEEMVRQVGAWFADISIPHYHLAGNHDLEALTLSENEELLNFSLSSTSIDLKGFHLVFWNAGSRLDREKGFLVLENELNWLEEDLSRSGLPTVIFTHVPLDNGSMTGNFYFEKAFPHHAGYNPADGKRIREVIERSNKVVLCVNGHAHWNAYHCIDGVHYVTIPSLTEMFPTYPSVCESWAKLSLENEIHLQVLGNLAMEYRFPMKQANGGHWLNVDKDYAPQVTAPK